MTAPLYPRTTGPGQQFLQVGPPPIIPIVQRVPSQVAVTREEFNAVASPPVERQATRAGMNQLLPTLFGTDQLGANITAMIVSGNNLLLRCEWCKALAPSTVDGVVSYLVDGKTPPVGATATHYDGSQTTPDATLVAAYAAQGKTYTDTLTGVSYSVVSIPAGTTQGFPRIVAQMRGIKVRTTSGGAYAYSDNPVWLVAWLLTERLGSSIDWSSFATAAAVCDALVGSPSEKKYIIGLSMDTEQDVWKWIDIVLGYIRGHRWFDNGLHGLTIETASQTSVMSLGVEMMRNGDIDIQSRNTSGQPTVVRIYYTNMQSTLFAEGYAEASLPGVGTTVPYILSEVRKPAINRHSQANREAIETLNEYHLSDLAGSFVTRDEGMRLLEGDVISISHPRGLSGKQVHVIGNIPVDTGRWRVDWREYDPARYSSVVVTVPTYGDTNLPLPTAPPIITNLTLTESSVNTGNAFTTHLQLVWPAVVWPFPHDYRVVIYDESVLVQDSTTTAAGFTSQPVAIGHNYRAFVYVRSAIAQSTGVYRSLTVSGSAAAAPGEMLWATFPIEPNATYLDKSFQRGLGDPQRHRYVSAWGASFPGSINYKDASWFEPDMASTGAIDHQILLLATGGGYPPVGGSWTPPAVVAGIGWKSSVITLFSGGHRSCRVVAALDRTTLGYGDLTPGIVYGPWELGVQQASRTNYGGGIAADLSEIEVTLEAVNSYAAVLVDTPGTLFVYTTTANEDQDVTSSASGAVVVTCENNYAKLKGLPKVTPLTTAARYPTIENISYGAVCTFELRIFNDAGALTATPCSITIEGTV